MALKFKKLSAGSGAVKIESEGTEIQAVPNNGQVEKMVFNTALTPTEVDTLITNAGLSFIELYGAPVYPVFVNADSNLAFIIVDYGVLFGNPDLIAYAIMEYNSETLFYASSILDGIVPTTGWNTEAFTAPGGNEILLNMEANATFEGLAVGTQNNLIKDLINIGGNESYCKELSGTYEPVDLNITENGVIDLVSEYMNNKQMPIKVNVETTGSLKSLLDKTRSTCNMFREHETLTFLTNKQINFNATSNVTDMSNMFYNCKNLTEIPLFDTSNVTNMYCMFYGCSELRTIPEFDTSNVTDMKYMFYNCKDLSTIPLLDTSNVTDMGHMFYKCTYLREVPEFNTSNVTNMDYMFYGCNVLLTTIPQLDTSNVTYMSNMFYGCSNLSTIPQLDTSNVTYMGYMFGSSSLPTIPQLDTSNVTNMECMFQSCTHLTEIPLLDTSNVWNMNSMFDGCKNLTTVESLDMIKTKSATEMFDGCTNLTNLTLLNIKENLQIGSGTSWGHLLTLDSLVNTCKECINTGSSLTLTVGTANLEKLANVYVKFTDSTVTAIASGEKGEVEVCESTDEGAMLIADYMALKNWSLA